MDALFSDVSLFSPSHVRTGRNDDTKKCNCWMQFHKNKKNNCNLSFSSLVLPLLFFLMLFSLFPQALIFLAMFLDFVYIGLHLWFRHMSIFVLIQHIHVGTCLCVLDLVEHWIYFLIIIKFWCHMQVTCSFAPLTQHGFCHSPIFVSLGRVGIYLGKSQEGMSFCNL